MNFDKNEICYPTELLCPITCSLLNDPVMTPDGHNFEKEKIYEWLKYKETNPLTQRRLTKKMLQPNPKLKETIKLIKGLTERNHHLENVIRKQLGQPKKTKWETNQEDQETTDQEEQSKTKKIKTVHQCDDCEPQIHPTIWCDKCNTNPIKGNRYWKIHKNYDLCETDYQQLEEAKKKEYVCIQNPKSDLSRVARHFINNYNY